MKFAWDDAKESIRTEGEVLITGACVKGTRHKKEGTPCQDVWSSFPAHGGGWIIVAADGLSSASHADEGAKIATFSAGEALASSLSRYPDQPDRTDKIREAVRIAREEVISKARKEENSPGLYASTLIIIVYEHGKITAGHIGDGIVVGIREGKTHIISPPATGEYANETACLVQDDWEEQLRITEYTHIDTCIMATDGCQGALAIRSDGQYSPHDPFILPLVSFIRQRLSANIDPRADIAALLMSPRMEQLSGDDKTLIVLTGGETTVS